ASPDGDGIGLIKSSTLLVPKPFRLRLWVWCIGPWGSFVGMTGAEPARRRWGTIPMLFGNMLDHVRSLGSAEP
ncbi:hypothetical protein OAV07_02360, partial [Acidimicrobiales bacterium]|nr:hypothetical protein [Acidimicrobiales bacterium]